MTELAPKLGGLVEFYRSPARVAWTPTGVNVPDYPKLAQLWWANVAEAVTGEKTPQAAMDNLAKQQDQVLARLERAGIGGDCAPKLNPEDQRRGVVRQVEQWRVRAQAQARQREAAGRHRRLRQAPAGLGRRQGDARRDQGLIAAHPGTA